MKYFNDLENYSEFEVTDFVKTQVEGDKVVSFLINNTRNPYGLELGRINI